MGEEIFISVVFPVYNEEKRLPQAFAEATAYLENLGRPWEIVVADDGSRDRTAALVSRWIAGEPRLSLIRLERNKGKGAAVKAGMLAARGRYRLFRDADDSTSMRELDRFLPLLERGAAIVIGSRRVPQARIEGRQHFFRESLGRCFTWLCRFLLVWEVRDYTCGFKCFAAKAAQEIFPRQRIGRWAFDAEILFLAKKLGFPIAQVPVVWHDAPGSKVSPGLDALRSLGELGMVLAYYWTGSYKLSGK